MILSTPGLVLHTTPYGDSSVVVKVFTRQLGVRSYMIKGVRGPRGRIKQNLLQPLSNIDMVVYDNPHNDLNHVKELASRRTEPEADAVGNALRFFMTEVLYKVLPEAEPMPELWDYVDGTDFRTSVTDFPIRFLLGLTHHLGIAPLDNYSARESYFDLQEGCYTSAPAETTLSPHHSSMLHEYIAAAASTNSQSLSFSPTDRQALLEALIAYFQLHLSGFHNFHSHEILHTILR